jgi:uridine kinase
MIGDRLVFTDYHRAAAAKVLCVLRQRLENGKGPVSVTVAGESGAGKSEVAICLAKALEDEGHRCIVLCQDDYFHLPPKSSHHKRLSDISWVGTGEVQLDLLGEHVQALKDHPGQPLAKPLVLFEEDRISSETLEPGPYDVIIAEGTYTTLLPDIDIRVFINRNFRQTKKARLARGRDPDVEFLEQVLDIEHREISRHRSRADVVIDPPRDELDD